MIMLLGYNKLNQFFCVYIDCFTKRNEIILVSKAGFIFHPQETNEATLIKNNQYFSIQPRYLESSISASLERLQLETIDFFMLNNPERLLSAQKTIHLDQLIEMMANSFRHLEGEVERGRITGYGIASNSLHISSSIDHIPLYTVLSNEFPNFSMIEYPLNLFERDAIEANLIEDMSLSEFCEKKSIYQLTQRPFHAITSKGIRKLTQHVGSTLETNINEKATKQFTLVIEMELELSGLLGMSSKGIANKFTNAQILAQNLSRLVENEMAAELFIKRDILHEKDFEELRLFAEELDQDDQEQVKRWIAEYDKQVKELIQCVLDISKYHSSRSNDELNSFVSLYCHRNESLAANALSVCLSATGPNTTVLCGMRTEKQVDVALKTLTLPKIEDGRLNALFESPLLE